MSLIKKLLQTFGQHTLRIKRDYTDSVVTGSTKHFVSKLAKKCMMAKWD